MILTARLVDLWRRPSECSKNTQNLILLAQKLLMRLKIEKLALAGRNRFWNLSKIDTMMLSIDIMLL